MRYVFSRWVVRSFLVYRGTSGASLYHGPTLAHHPNTIAYPERFFESAQAIAAHSYLRWPDLSRECLRRQHARIERVDWESKLPCVLGPRKSRLSPFTRKQQELLDKAREMEGVLDLSALLEGRLQLLPKKKMTADGLPDPTGSENVGTDQGGAPDHESLVHKNTLTVKAKKRAVGAHRSTSSEGDAPIEAAALPEEASKVSKKRKGKGKDNSTGDQDREETGKDLGDDQPIETVPEGQPKKKTKKRPAEMGTLLLKSPSPDVPLERKRQRGVSGDVPRGRIIAPKESAPASGSLRGGSHSEGSLAKKARGGSHSGVPDRVSFTYDEKTPLVFNPRQCAELTRQIRSGTKELPLVDDLFFRDEYIDAASAGRRRDGSVNNLLERYDSALKQTMGQLGASQKLPRVRLGVIERLRAEQKKAEDKAAEEREVLQVKFAELDDKLKSDRAARKELAREKARLEQANAALEKDKDELLEERDAAVEKFIRERKLLRDSRSQEVTHERVRVQTAMIDKSSRCFSRIRDYLSRRNSSEKAKNLYGQASGTRKFLKMVKDSGAEISQELIDIFIDQEKQLEAEVASLGGGPLPLSDLVLSPLVLPSRFSNEEFMATLDPYGSNDDLIGSETASRLQTPCEPLEDQSTGHPEETVVDNTLALMDQVPILEKSVIEEDAELAREEGSKSACPKDLVEVSDTSSEEQEEEGQTEDVPSATLPEPDEANKIAETEGTITQGGGDTLVPGANLAVPVPKGGEEQDVAALEVNPLVPSVDDIGDPSLLVAEGDREVLEPDGRVGEDGSANSELIPSECCCILSLFLNF
ncbi:hypothetical protein Bca52824_018239 [Brassica carinata]|uniref:Uncharacterized protein n=1 Tax=Brassica carinata TaxID=52824 RepID=A0A8X8AZ80_BRACI|nr:hypothetical protein Bca52824_018239 [Brassica carinata]